MTLAFPPVIPPIERATASIRRADAERIKTLKEQVRDFVKTLLQVRHGLNSAYMNSSDRIFFVRVIDKVLRLHGHTMKDRRHD